MNTAGIQVFSDDLVKQRVHAKDIKLESRQRSRSAIDGSSRSSRRGRGMEFSEVRHYQAGDDIRNIDWRVTARTQETYTKLFQEEKERPVYLIVDQRSTMFFGSNHQFKSVLAAELASIIAWSAYNNRDKIGAFVFGDQKQYDLRPKQGKHALFRFLHDLADSNQSLFKQTLERDQDKQPRVSTADILVEARRMVRPGSLVFVLSDLSDFNDDTQKALSLLSRHCDIELLRVFDPLETSLPNVNKITLSNGVQRLKVNTSNKALTNTYQQQWHALSQRIQTDAANLKVSLHHVSTESSAAQHCRQIFLMSRRGKS